MGMEIYANCHTSSSTCPDFLSVEAPGDGEENSNQLKEIYA